MKKDTQPPKEITFKLGERSKEWVRKTEDETGLAPEFACAAIIEQVAIEVLSENGKQPKAAA